MTRTFVSVGSNIDKEKNIQAAINSLDCCYGPLTLSKVYESVAVGFRGDNFYNLVAAFDTNDTVEVVAARLASIEEACGRRRSENSHEARTLDIDLLVYGNLCRHDKDFDLPRHEINEYAFVLLPLADIAPDLKHPETGISFGEMWRNFRDGNQRLWPVSLDIGCL